MLKRLAIILVVFCICGLGEAQEQTDDIADVPCENIPGKKCDSISDRTWFKKINQTFGVVATGQTEAANLANYGSFEPVNGSFKLNLFGPIGSTDKKKVAFFNINAGGKIIGDNLGVLFNNSKFGSGMSLSGKIHIPILTKIDVSGNQVDTISRRIKLLADQKQKQVWQAQQDFDKTYLKVSYRNDTVKLLNIIKEINRNRIALDAAISNINTLNPEDTINLLKLTKTVMGISKKFPKLYEDSLTVLDRVNITKSFLDDDFLRGNSLAGVLFSNDTAYKNKREALEMSVNIKGSNFLWLTLVGSLERKKYYTFSDVLPFGSQFDDHKFTKSSGGIEINFIGFSGKKNNPIAGKLPHIHIANLGILRTRNNNIDDLNTTELTDSRKFSSRDSTHSLSTKYNVYTDDIITYDAWKIYLNYYYYLGKKRNMALHVSPDAEFRNTNKNPFNISVGLVLALKNKKDNALFNVEFYGKLVDVGKALPEQEVGLFNRNQIGLNFGIPISFK